jgi:type I restriction enzyme S subunit
MTMIVSAKQKIREGYIQTEAGVIPMEWQLRPLLKAVRIASGQVNPRIEPYNSMVLVAPDHIESGSGRLLKKETAGEQGAISGKYLFEAGDIVYSKIRPYLRKAILADFKGLCSADMYPLKPVNDVSPGFAFATILGHRFSKYAESVSVRSGIPKINRTELAEYLIALPPTIDEQEAIANILLDVDSLIRKVEELIEKKMKIKQGAMQELLTGKSRLPGFSEEWETTTLGKVAKFEHGYGLSKSDLTDDGHSKCIHYGQLFTEYKESIRKIKSKTNINVNNFYSKENDVLMPTSDVTPRGLATASCIKDNGVILGGGILVIRLYSGYDGLYLSYFITFNKNVVLQLVKGSTVFHLYAGDLANLEVSFPKHEEQQAIVKILSDMDTEIEKLESELAKYRNLKQGMMQNLLTGKIRLNKKLWVTNH